MKFSKTTGCFYPDNIHYPNPPADLITVTADDYSAAMNRAAGETLDVVKGKLVIVPAPAPDPVAVLAAAKTNAFTRIDQFHSDVIARLVGNPTQTEKDTWAMKLDTANAIALGQLGPPVSSAGAAFLQAAGLKDASAQANWAQAVLAKSTDYAKVVGIAERLRDAAKTAVKAANDEAMLKAALNAQQAIADAAISTLLSGK